MKLSDSQVASYLACPTKAYLVGSQAPPTDPEFAEHNLQLAIAFRGPQLTALRKKYLVQVCPKHLSIAQVFEQTQAEILLDCSIATDHIETVLHGIQGLKDSDEASDGRYIPVRFVPSVKITKADRVLLAFDAIAIKAHFGRMPAFGLLIYGENGEKCKVNLTANLVQEARDCIDRLASFDRAPELALNKHCADCQFQSNCLEVARKVDDLSLLSGMSHVERQRLRAKGISSVTQLSFTFRVRRNRKDPNSACKRRHHALTALAIREGKVFVLGQPILEVGNNPVFLDIEGLPHRDLSYLIGMCFWERDSLAYQSFWADDASDEPRMWNDFLKRLKELPEPRILHYGAYDKECLLRMIDRYERHPDNAFITQLVADSRNVLSTIFSHFYFPVRSNGLKDIARFLGCQWTDTLASGARATVWRTQWDATRAAALKQKLLLYNEEDCRALAEVARVIASVCDGASQQNFLPAAATLAEQSFWKKKFAVTEFDKINKASYWDHQRNLVYVKSSRRLKVLAKRHSPKPKHLEPTKTIEPARPAFCPSCGNGQFYIRAKSCRKVLDIGLTGRGLSRRIHKYVARTFKCRSCGKTTVRLAESWPRHKYGQGLVAYVVYQLVELALLQRTVSRSMNDLFGFGLPPGATRYIKSIAAQHYDRGSIAIKERILAGALIHADETRVKLRDGSEGYVWVITNLEEAYFFFTASRACDKVRDMLCGFHGVLVTDFYAGYDSIPCPQQKCLIHLMRDLNDDLLRQPFNDELKRLASDFASLLTAIIRTIDSQGLKRTSLINHQPAVSQFFEHLSTQQGMSDVYRQYKDRFIRNRDKLFTFLAHDGVPWNNNNAEHAIKQFAKLRKSIDGCNQVNGVTEYLVLLSICTTCKYRGVNVLQFLRSGCGDILQYAEERRPRRRAN